ncbi:MAG: hypothetical protein ACRC3Y_02620, partial [Romboutsia sp.]|uniref:hypothetical protein n=1 Tax=Romboutsia sp. TaxID=1965302 RepID=UPI003F2A8471
DLIIGFKSLFKENLHIVLGGYRQNYETLNELDIIANLYNKFPELNGLVDLAYLINDSKSYEIFTSLSDTQRIYIQPNSSCTISGPTLNYHMKNLNPINTTHISFVSLMDNCSSNDVMDCYIKGFTNKNNNFNYNL